MDERRWWELQLGTRLVRSFRHLSPVVDERPPDTLVRPERHLRAVPPPVDEQRWWEMQLGKSA